MNIKEFKKFSFAKLHGVTFGWGNFTFNFLPAIQYRHTRDSYGSVDSISIKWLVFFAQFYIMTKPKWERK